MEHLMEIMTTGTETFCIVLLLNTFFERKYTSYRFFFPLSAAFLFYLWLPLNTILATSFVTKLFTLLGISYIFSFSFSDALSNSALYILGAFVSRTLLLLFSIIIYRLFKAKTSMILSSSTWIALLLFPVFSILLFGVTIEIAMAQNQICLFYFLYILISHYFFYLASWNTVPAYSKKILLSNMKLIRT